MSAALSFRTIFALVPILVLAVLVLESVGIVDETKPRLRKALIDSGFAQIALNADAATSQPTDSDEDGGRVVNVADEIEALVDNVQAKFTFRRVGPVGVVLLIWTAITLMTTIERSLNRIFRAKRARPLGRRVLLYWSALSLGPLLLIVAEYLSRKAMSVFALAPGVGWVLRVSGWAMPILVGLLVLAAAYKLMPNTHVRYRSAIGGAVVALPLWLLAKWGFAIYVTKLVLVNDPSSVGAGNLYGALGLLPLFLVWLNLSWLIFLFGAQLAHTAANLGVLEVEEALEDEELGPRDFLAATLAVAQPYLDGAGPVALHAIANRLRMPEDSAERLLDQLEAAKIVVPVENDREPTYVLGRPVDKIDLLEVIGLAEPSNGEADVRYEPDLRAAVDAALIRPRSRLGPLALSDLISQNP